LQVESDVEVKTSGLGGNFLIKGNIEFGSFQVLIFCSEESVVVTTGIGDFELLIKAAGDFEGITLSDIEEVVVGNIGVEDFKATGDSDVITLSGLELWVGTPRFKDFELLIKDFEGITFNELEELVVGAAGIGDIELPLRVTGDFEGMAIASIDKEFSSEVGVDGVLVESFEVVGVPSEGFGDDEEMASNFELETSCWM
jgi:hypothetical protein